MYYSTFDASMSADISHIILSRVSAATLFAHGMEKKPANLVH